MRKTLLFIVCVVSMTAMAQNATIRINTSRIIGEIDPNIYGVFMEPISFKGHPGSSMSGSTLYGPLYDPSSPLANKDGFKTNYIDAMKELKIRNMRWPGGNYVAGYNWQDGIGPKDQRPIRKDLAWGGVDTNQVGTDEWIALNRAIGSENIICINLGLGDISNARYWIEYCNSDEGTTFAKKRAENGHPKPYNVKYWGLGNEVDGEPWIMGHKDVDDYCKVAVEAAKALKSVDKSIQLVASGSSYYEPTGKWLEWNRKVITALTGVADYLSIHRYWSDGTNSKDYYDYVGDAAMDIESKITTVQSQVNIVKALYPAKKPLYLTMDEWGTFGQSMREVLALTMNLNSFIRHADFVKMSDFTMLTSLLSTDKDKGTFKSPFFYAYKLFSNNCLGSSVDTQVICDTFDAKVNKGIPFLDVTTVYSKADGKIYINVANRNQNKAITADIFSDASSFSGKAVASQICYSLDDKFVYAADNVYAPVKKNIDTKANKMTFAFPAHSFTQIAVNVK